MSDFGADDKFRDGSVAGQAALTALEALLTTLVDAEMLRDDEVSEIFECSIAVHEQESAQKDYCEFHSSVATVLRQLQVHGNGSRSRG